MPAKQGELPKQISWISTHPDSEERSKAILERMKDQPFDKQTILDSIQWNNLKENLRKE